MTSVVSGGRTPDTQSAGRLVGGGDAAAHPTNHTEQVSAAEQDALAIERGLSRRYDHPVSAAELEGES